MAKYYPPVLNLRGLFDKVIEAKLEEVEENKAIVDQEVPEEN